MLKCPRETVVDAPADNVFGFNHFFENYDVFWFVETLSRKFGPAICFQHTHEKKSLVARDRYFLGFALVINFTKKNFSPAKKLCTVY